MPQPSAPEESADVAEDDGGEIYAGVHAAVLLSIDIRPTTVLAEVMSMWRPHSTTAEALGLLPFELTDPRFKSRVRPLATTVDGEHGLLLTNGESSHAGFDVNGRALQPVTLRLVDDDGSGDSDLLAADISAFGLCGEELWLRI